MIGREACKMIAWYTRRMSPQHGQFDGECKVLLRAYEHCEEEKSTEVRVT